MNIKKIMKLLLHIIYLLGFVLVLFVFTFVVAFLFSGGDLSHKLDESEITFLILLKSLFLLGCCCLGLYTYNKIKNPLD